MITFWLKESPKLCRKQQYRQTETIGLQTSRMFLEKLKLITIAGLFALTHYLLHFCFSIFYLTEQTVFVIVSSLLRAPYSFHGRLLLCACPQNHWELWNLSLNPRMFLSFSQLDLTCSLIIHLLHFVWSLNPIRISERS